MFDSVAFGARLRLQRKAKNLTQDEVAAKIGVSGQAVSKWEKGECLPDVYNLKLLGRLYRVSVDSLLDVDGGSCEQVAETIQIGGAVFEIVEKPATLLAGRILYAKDFGNSIENALASLPEEQRWLACEKVTDCTQPVCDITLSVNFWHKEKHRALGFVRETMTENQPEGIDVYKMPASLYIRAYTSQAMVQLLTKQQCEIWELFAYIRRYFMPTHGFRENENGAQEMEVFDTAAHTTGYAYMPVVRVKAKSRA